MYKVIVVILLMILGPTACEINDCGETPEYFSINGLEIFNAKFTAQETNPWKGVEINEAFLWQHYLMRVGFEITYFSENKNSLGAAVYGDCLSDGYKGSKIGVDTLYLVALSDYNDTLHQNDTLNSIALVNNEMYYADDINRFYPITNYINQNRTSIQNHALALKLAEAPFHDSGDYQFRLIFILSNEETFVKESDKVRLIK